MIENSSKVRNAGHGRSSSSGQGGGKAAWWMLRGSASIGGASAVMAKACDLMASGRGVSGRGVRVWARFHPRLDRFCAPTPFTILQPAFAKWTTGASQVQTRPNWVELMMII